MNKELNDKLVRLGELNTARATVLALGVVGAAKMLASLEAEIKAVRAEAVKLALC